MTPPCSFFFSGPLFAVLSFRAEFLFCGSKSAMEFAKKKKRCSFGPRGVGRWSSRERSSNPGVVKREYPPPTVCLFGCPCTLDGPTVVKTQASVGYVFFGPALNFSGWGSLARVTPCVPLRSYVFFVLYI